MLDGNPGRPCGRPEDDVIVQPGSSRSWARGSLILAALALLAVACASESAPGGAEKPKSLPALKIAVLSAIGGRLAYCDPD